MSLVQEVPERWPLVYEREQEDVLFSYYYDTSSDGERFCLVRQYKSGARMIDLVHVGTFAHFSWEKAIRWQAERNESRKGEGDPSTSPVIPPFSPLHQP